MSKRKDKQQVASTKKVDGGWDESKGFSKGGNPFASLLSPEQQAQGEAPQAQEAQRATSPAEIPAPKRASIHVQRKGRGGKTVTVVSHLGFTREDYLEHWCTSWRQQLGCGGQVELEEIVLQGDQRQRVREILEKMGVTRIAGG